MNAPIPLNMRVLDGHSRGPHLLVTAGVHGDEFEGMAAIRKLISEIDTRQLSGRLTLVAVVNEPAFIRGGRTADDGLDLARTCPGRSNGSVTERIAHAVSLLIRAADYYVDLHSGGGAMCITPLVGYMLHADAVVLEHQRRMARAFNLPLIWGTSPALEGRTLSVARDANVPTIYAEYRGSGVCSRQGVEDYAQGCLNVMNVLGMLQRPVPMNRVERIVEDSRPNSGHLQICHPAPMTGFFEPAVQLGQKVQAGEPIGSVTDSLGLGTCDILAEHDGLIICLATFSRVLQGHGLAVVLEDQDSESH